jgi:hypothetical protein
MNAVQLIANDTAATHGVIHIWSPEDKTGRLPKDSEEVMEQIRLRATIMGPILEGILHEPHDLAHGIFVE